MKKLTLTLVALFVVGFIGCGKKNDNPVTTPQNCYANGMSPAYMGGPGAVPYNNGWNTGWGQQYPQQQMYQQQMYPPQQGAWNPQNQGCVGMPGQPNYNGWNYNQVYYNNNPYYYIPGAMGGSCEVNTTQNTCPSGFICQAQNNMYFYQLTWNSGFSRMGVCVRVQ